MSSYAVRYAKIPLHSHTSSQGGASKTHNNRDMSLPRTRSKIPDWHNTRFGVVEERVQEEPNERTHVFAKAEIPKHRFGKL
jgi:hypothetical protein